MSEVVFPRKGELSVRDVRAVYGADVRQMAHVDVLVLDEHDGVPVAARVDLAESRWGWSHRTRLVCPTCEERRESLVARAGRLQCKGCHNDITRRARERTVANFTRRGGLEEDRVLRLLRPAPYPDGARLGHARRLVQNIVAADHSRLDVLGQQLQDLEVWMRVAG